MNSIIEAQKELEYCYDRNQIVWITEVNEVSKKQLDKALKNINNYDLCFVSGNDEDWISFKEDNI